MQPSPLGRAKKLAGIARSNGYRGVPVGAGDARDEARQYPQEPKP
jgi:hypothetical protein